jgi:hypothetical protein
MRSKQSRKKRDRELAKAQKRLRKAVEKEKVL